MKYQKKVSAEELKYRLKTYTTPNTFDQSYETSAGILNVLAAMTGDTYDFTPSKPVENKQLEYLIQYIIQNYKAFSSIEPKHKNEFLARTKFKEEDFMLCESMGLGFADSYSIIKSISKNSVLSIADALRLYELKNKDMERYINEAACFNIFTHRYLANEDTDFYVKVLLEHGNANAIRAAYVVSESLGIAFEEIYSDKKDLIQKDTLDKSINLTEEDINILNQMLELFPVNSKRILEHIKTRGRKPDEIYKAIKEYEMDIAEKNGEILRPLSSQEPNFDKYSYAPFTYKTDRNESINTSNGSLRITDNVILLKGRNGMDLNLSLVYDSSMSNLYEPGYYVTTDYSYVVWLTYKVNVLSVYGTLYYTYDNLGWVYDSTYYSYQSALQRANQLNTMIKTNDLYHTSYFERYHYNTRVLYYNENGVLTSIGPWSNVDGSILYPNGYPVEGYTPNLPRTGTITGDQNNPYYVYWPNGKVKEKHETWVGIYSGYATSVNPIGYQGYYYNTSISEYANNTYYNTANPNTYRERSKFGAGWAFELPGIEFSGQGGTVLHLNGLQYKYKYTADATDSNLEGYSLKDIRLEVESGAYFNGVLSSYYTLYHKDGKRDYFDSNGMLIGSKDRHGNEIKYRYTTFAGNNVLNKIIDSVGREINISYTDSGSQREIKITVANTGFEVKYLLEKIPGENANDYRLVRKTDEGNRQTQYQYILNTSYFNLMSKTSRNTYSKYALLSRITYPTGGFTEYTYSKYIENLGSQGTQENYRIETRKEVWEGKEYNKKTYSYSQDNYTGYPSLPDPSNLGSSFSYWTSSKDNNGFETKMIFNNRHLPVTIQKIDNGVQKETNTMAYNNDKLPILSIKTAYEADGASLSAVENYAYDQYRNMTGYWGVLSNRDASNNPLNDEHKTTYTYNGMFHYLTKKEYKKDADTLIREEYVPTSDNKSVQWARIYENGELKQQTWYAYDTYGNVTEERRYLGDWSTYINTKYSYADNVEERNGQFNGLYVTRKWVEGIKDADGNDVAAREGNNAGTVDETYTYNRLGQLISFQDGMGNITAYTYDNLGRVTSKTNPDAATSQWIYNDALNKLLHSNENGYQTEYGYDAFGNLIYEKDITSTQTIMRYEYDDCFRLKKELSHNNKTVTEYFYNNDGRLNKKEIKENGNILLQRETYQYTDALEGQYKRIAKTTEGQPGCPSMTTYTYINIQGKTSKTVRMLGSIEIIDTFRYDYAGNNIEKKEARAYEEGWDNEWTSKFEYDYAGRVVRSYNVNGEFTTTQYDALGRVIATRDIKGNMSQTPYETQYKYDSLGRLIVKQQVNPLS